MATSCYAIRRLNPFLGVIQIIETNRARAISVNGVVWDIEVGVYVPVSSWGSLNAEKTEVAWYRYGLWSEEDGLVNRPLSPQYKNYHLHEHADHLIDEIKNNLKNIPFSLQDTEELWLLDISSQQPIALLASCREDALKPRPEPRKWQACITGDGLPSQRRYPQSHVIEEAIKKRASFNLQKHWFSRQQNGDGICHISGQRLDADLFPRFLVTQQWSDAEDARRVDEFIQWTAPALLTLQHLNDEERRMLEDKVIQQATSIEYHWHLYPDILDESKINSARVKSRLEKAL